MKSKHLYLSLIILQLVSFTGIQCKKFEDDPELIHLKTVKKRITGYKVLEEDYVGSYGMLHHWEKKFGACYLHFTAEPYRHDTTGYGYRMFIRKQATNEEVCEGEWGFKTSEAIFWRLDCFDAQKSRFFPNRLFSWSGNITRLSDSEMWMEGEAIDSLKQPVHRTMRFIELRK
jgi:hypothetical protein